MDVINRIVGLLGTDSASADTDPTSMRIPSPLREAAKLSHEHLGAPSATAMAVAGLRETIETAVIRAALEDHYAEHPWRGPRSVRSPLPWPARTATLLPTTRIASFRPRMTRRGVCRPHERS